MLKLLRELYVSDFHLKHVHKRFGGNNLALAAIGEVISGLQERLKSLGAEKEYKKVKYECYEIPRHPKSTFACKIQAQMAQVNPLARVLDRDLVPPCARRCRKRVTLPSTERCLIGALLEALKSMTAFLEVFGERCSLLLIEYAAVVKIHEHRNRSKTYSMK